MDDAKKFLRYIAPGLSFVFEVTICLSIVLLPFAKQITGGIKDIPIEKLSMIGAVLGIVTIGGVGYFFSIIHHFLFWYCKCYPSTVYKDFLRRMESAKLIAIPDFPKKIDNEWGVVNTLWHSLKVKSDILEKNETMTTRLPDVMHNAGAAYIGAWFVIPTTIIIAKYIFYISGVTMSHCYSAILAFIIAAILIIVHCFGYKKTVENCQYVIESILETALCRYNNNDEEIGCAHFNVNKNKNDDNNNFDLKGTFTVRKKPR